MFSPSLSNLKKCAYFSAHKYRASRNHRIEKKTLVTFLNLTLLLSVHEISNSRESHSRKDLQKKKEKKRKKRQVRLIASFRNGVVVSRFGCNFHEETNFLAGWNKEGKVRRAGPI